MTSRLIKFVLVGIATGLLIFLGIVLIDWYIERSMTRSWRAGLIRQLESIHSFDEAVNADPRLSSILGERDDAWILLGYEDTHNGRLLSVTVAKTEDGRWFESRRHFCAGINSGANANRYAAQYQTMLDEHPEDDTLHEAIEGSIRQRDTDELWLIGKEPDPEKQVQMLIEAGFWEFEGPG